jgi:hypothetical protein
MDTRTRWTKAVQNIISKIKFKTNTALKSSLRTQYFPFRILADHHKRNKGAKEKKTIKYRYFLTIPFPDEVHMFPLKHSCFEHAQ